jgi:hypothetical protein
MQEKFNHVRLQPFENLTSPSDLANVYYIEYSEQQMDIRKALVQLSLTEDEALHVIDKMLATFPKHDEVDYAVTERAVGKHLTESLTNRKNIIGYKNSVYYNGDSSVSGPIIVATDGNKFGIFQNPNFKHFGYTLD